MLFIRRFFLFGILLIPGFYCLARQGNSGLNTQNPADTFETHVKNSLVSYYSKYPQEKVFIHTSQDIYSAGETIWYKIYATAYGKPDALSKIIYVQLTDTAGNIIAQNKLPLLNGKAHGNIDIGQKIKPGWYSLNAFTSWMMNFDRQAWYRQQVYITNPADTPLTAAKEEVTKKKYHINFYPEGGSLIAGNLTKIAFKAYSDDGLPARVEGIVKDNSNNILEKLVTVHDGMGEFTIEAIAGNSYSAAVQFPNGGKQTIKLPEVSATGVNLQASQTPDTIHLKLAFAGPKEKFENCVLAAFQNNGQINTYPLQLLRGINEFDLQKGGFSTGILRLTVFDHDGLPQAERILFINKHDLPAAALKTDTLSFLPGGRNSFSMLLKNGAGRPVNGNFSVAVTDGAAFKDSIGQNIFSALLLSPELKGEVYTPGYYFKNENDSLSQQLDLVMLTNGWRHFSWHKVLNNEKYPIQHPVEQSPYVAGEVLNYKALVADKENFKIKLVILNPDSTKFIGYITPDSTGRFIIKDFNHRGMSDIYLQTADKKKHIKKLQVKMLTTLYDSLKRMKADSFAGQSIPSLPGYYISAEQRRQKEFLIANSILLDTVTIKGKKVSPTDKLIAAHVSAKYQSDREFTLDLVNDPTVDMALIDYIRGKFPGLQILGSKDNPAFIYRGGNTLQQIPSRPLIGIQAKMGANSSSNSSNSSTSNSYLPYFYLNEAQVPYGVVEDISLVEMAMIRFMPPPVWFAPFNGGNEGAIMIYTKQQSDEVRKMTGMSDFDHYIYNGFSITREFNQPGYNKPHGQIIGDNRLTLYWAHDLDTDNDGVLKFRFYNSGTAKQFKVIIQGMDAQGRLVYWEQILK